MKWDFGSAQRAYGGESVCGDAVFIAADEPGLVAVVDGLGHGPEAANAAQAFVQFVELHRAAPLDAALHEASRRIAHTRGVAAGLVQLSRPERTLRFAGVGNIEVKAQCRAAVHPVCASGIVGRPLRRVTVYEYTMFPGDTLALMTDGVSTRFELGDLDLRQSPQALAETILFRFGKHTDDATCVVMRCESSDCASCV